jgi:hypothetical protein
MTAPEFQSILAELRRANSRLDTQGLELNVLRNELDIQFKRIASLQAELDLQAAHTRRGRRTSSMVGLTVNDNGNGQRGR